MKGGEFMAGLAKHVPYVENTQMVEALAVREGLKFGIEMSFKEVFIEGNAEWFQDCFAKKLAVGSDLEPVFEDCIRVARIGKVKDFCAVKVV